MEEEEILFARTILYCCNFNFSELKADAEFHLFNFLRYDCVVELQLLV